MPNRAGKVFTKLYTVNTGVQCNWTLQSVQSTEHKQPLNQ